MVNSIEFFTFDELQRLLLFDKNDVQKKVSISLA